MMNRTNMRGTPARLSGALLLGASALMAVISMIAAGEQSGPPKGGPTVEEQAWLKHGFTEAQRQSIRDVFRWGMDQKYVPGGSLLLIHRGETVMREGFGVADIETKEPFTVDAPCRIASVTKPHTATLMAMLVEEGKLSWDDPVDKYLPRFANVTVRGKGPASRPPMVRELLSHTAGFAGQKAIRSGQWRIQRSGTLAAAVDDITSQGLAAEPGKGFVYTGMGYMVAARIAEVVTGKEFGALMKERLLASIGANTATFSCSASEELKARLPSVYERQDGRLVKSDTAGRGEESVAFPNPAGGLISTLDDLGRFFLLHRNRGMAGGAKLIAPESLRALYRTQPATGRAGYGLGFNILRTDAQGEGVRVRHTGGSGTWAMLDFENDLILVLLTQVPQTPTEPFRLRVVKAVMAVFAPEDQGNPDAETTGREE